MFVHSNNIVERVILRAPLIMSVIRKVDLSPNNIKILEGDLYMKMYSYIIGYLGV